MPALCPEKVFTSYFYPANNFRKNSQKNMIRKILSIIAGYAIFAVTALALFKLSKQDPHADPSTLFVILTAVYAIICSFLTGLVTQLIARTKNLKINYLFALIIAGIAAFSSFKSAGNHWTQLLAIFIFSPASILGGSFYNNRYNK